MFTPDNLDADSHLADHKLTLEATPKKKLLLMVRLRVSNIV